MPSKCWKPRTAIFMALGMVSSIILPLSRNIKVLAQVPAAQSASRCSYVDIQYYINQLNTGEPATFEALVACQSKAVPDLIKAIEKKDENGRIITIAVLGQLGSQAAPAVLFLIESLKDTSSDVHLIVVHTLVQIGKDAVPALITALQDPDSSVRSRVAYALGKMGTQAKDAVPALISALKEDENWNVSHTAADALGKIGKDAVPALIAALQDPDSSVRAGAADVLGKMRAEAKDAVPALISALKDEDRIASHSAADALGKIGKDAVPALIAALQDPNSDVRSGAADALRQIGSEAKDAVPELTKVFLNTNEDREVRYEAINALENIASDQAISVLNRYRETADAIKQEVLTRGAPSRRAGGGGRLVFPALRGAPSGEAGGGGRLVRQATTTYVNANPPVMCRIPVIRAVLRWKCS